MASEKTFSLNEVARRWGVELSTVVDWVNSGMLRRTDDRRVTQSEVLRFERAEGALIEAARKA